MIKRNKKIIQIIMCSVAMVGILQSKAYGMNTFKELNNSVNVVVIAPTEEQNKNFKRYSELLNTAENNLNNRNLNDAKHIIDSTKDDIQKPNKKDIITSESRTILLNRISMLNKKYETEKIKAKEEEERELRIITEYQNNNILKEAFDAYINYEESLTQRTHEDQLGAALNLSQKLKIATDSGKVSKEAIEHINDLIKKLEPLYSNLLNEGKNKEIKPIPAPRKSNEEISKIIKENVKAKPIPKGETKKELPKTGANLDNNLLLQIGASLSLLGAYIIKNKK